MQSQKQDCRRTEMEVSNLFIGVPAAIAAAAAFGLAGYLQHDVSQRTTDHGTLRPTLLLELLGFNRFRWSIVLSGVAFGLQVLALRFAPLAIVQPLLITGVLFYLGFAALKRHHQIDNGLLLGALMALTGLSGFLVFARPSGGTAQFRGTTALPLGLALVAVVVACVFVALGLADEFRALPLAVATAVFYGVTAALIKSLLTTTSWSSLFTHWELYAVVVVAPIGFLLNQNAFQVGSVGAAAVATITTGDPIVAIAAGLFWLGESVGTGPVRTTGEILALTLMAFGILILTRRSQRIVDERRGYKPQNASPTQA